MTAVRLELGVKVCVYEKDEGPWLRWFRPNGTLVPTRAEAHLTAEAARQMAETARQEAEALAGAERRRAEEAEAELAELKARLAKLEPG